MQSRIQDIMSIHLIVWVGFIVCMGIAVQCSVDNILKTYERLGNVRLPMAGHIKAIYYNRGQIIWIFFILFILSMWFLEGYVRFRRNYTNLHKRMSTVEKKLDIR